MKAGYALGVGLTVTTISTGAWVGCTSSTNTGPTDSGTESGSSGGGSSSSSGSSSGAGSEGGGSSGSSSSSSSSGGGGGDGGREAGPLTWTQVYADIVRGHCAPCHSPPPEGGTGHEGFVVGHLDMSSVDAGYANLIGQPPQGTASVVPGYEDAAVCSMLGVDAGSDSGILRVIPGNPGASLLSLKVRGYFTVPPCGAPMPAGGALAGDAGPTQSAAFQEIKAWILADAQP
jgi:hypothetical protein